MSISDSFKAELKGAYVSTMIVEHTDSKQSISSFRKASALLAFLGLAIVGLFATQPAKAETNEQYAFAVPASATTPALFYAYLKAGESLTVRLGKDDLTADPTSEGWKYYRHRSFYSITDPTGSLVQSNDISHSNPLVRAMRQNGASMDVPSTQPDVINVTAATAGIYTIAVRKVNEYYGSGFPWEIKIEDSSGSEVKGRVWTETYSMVEQWPPSFGGLLSTPELNGLDLDYWFVSAEGYKYKLTLNGYVGWNSVIEASLFGVSDSNCIPTYKSRVMTGWTPTNCGGLYKLFFEVPNSDLPITAPRAATSAHPGATSTGSIQEWVTPNVVEPTVTISGFTPDSAASPLVGEIDYTIANFSGNYDLVIDADGDGSFDGALDRKIPLSTVGDYNTPTALSYDFDGLDGAGNPIDADTLVKFQFRISKYPELHFNLTDVEQLAGGITLNRLNGSNISSDRLYWDHSDFTETCSDTYPGDGTDNAKNPLSALNGIPSSTTGVNYWRTDDQDCRDGDHPDARGSYGESKVLDFWTYAASDVRSDFLLLGESLTVAKRADNGSSKVKIGDDVEFTVTAQNNGSTDFDTSSPAVIVDDISDLLTAANLDTSSLSATVNGTPVAAPVLSGTRITWQGPLAAGERVVISYDVKIKASSKTSVINRAHALGAVGDPLYSNSTCRTRTTINTGISYNCASYQLNLGKAQGPKPPNRIDTGY